MASYSIGAPLRALGAFLASDSAAGEKPRQGAAESAALFSPEMIEAINYVCFPDSSAEKKDDDSWTVRDARAAVIAKRLTREQAIRRAFELSRGEKGGRTP